MKKLKENKKIKRPVKSWLFLLLLPVLLIAYLYFSAPAPVTVSGGENEMERITKEGVLVFNTAKELLRIDIEIADTETDRQNGLMYRDDISYKEGMLFIFDDIDYRAFWMKNTKIPLDILFVDENQKIVDIAYGAVPFSEQSIISSKKTKYVIEVKAGFVSVNEIKIGDMISYKRN